MQRFHRVATKYLENYLGWRRWLERWGEQFASHWPAGGSWTGKVISTINADIAKKKLDFDCRGGVVVLPREMLDSPAYDTLSSNAKALMIELQKHGCNDQPIAFGVREAAGKLHRRKTRPAKFSTNLPSLDS